MVAVGDFSAEREEQRASARREAAVRCWIDDGNIERYTRLADLSEGGARVLTANPPPVGTTFSMRLQPEDASPVQLCAVVVWRSEGFRGRGGIMGIRFVPGSDLKALEGYLQTPVVE